MNRWKFLTLPVYAVAFLLILIPALDTLLATVPVRASEVAWRYGAAGLFSRALMTPLLGVVMIFAVALLREQNGVLRLLSLLCGLAAVLLLGVLGSFGLDALQMRAQVRAEVVTAFDAATAVAAGKYLVTSGIFLLLSLSAWRAMRTGTGAAQRARPAASAPLIVRDRAETVGPQG